jgi:hypothetical protein
MVLEVVVLLDWSRSKTTLGVLRAVDDESGMSEVSEALAHTILSVSIGTVLSTSSAVGRDAVPSSRTL